MPSSITLHVIQSPNAPVPHLDLAGNKTIEEWYGSASTSAIQLSVRDETSKFPSSVGCDAARLQAMLRDSIPAPPMHQLVHDIALIICRSWVTGGLLGLMFDYDGHDDSLGDFSSQGVPREACAIFMDPHANLDPVEQSISAIHELGHVFNLRHDPSNSSFMAATASAIGFEASDEDLLTRAGRGDWPAEWDQMPGGANFLGTLGAARRISSKVVQNKKQPSARALTLTAHISKGSFLIGEPIVLDLSLEAGKGHKGSVLNRLDPGYDNLKIWIEHPDGERRLYRPPLRYCRQIASETWVALKDPLHHNPRISVGNRGLTFRHPGCYRLWADFTTSLKGGGSVVRSHVVEFEVRPPRQRGEEEISRTFADPGIALFIAQKGGVLSRGKQKALSDVVQKHSKHPSVKFARYALASHFEGKRRFQQAADLLRGLRPLEPSVQQGVDRLRGKIAAHLGRS